MNDDVTKPDSGVHCSLQSLMAVGISNFCKLAGINEQNRHYNSHMNSIFTTELPFLACSLISFNTALIITGESHKSSNLLLESPSFSAISSNCLGFGTIKAMTKFLDDSAYAQISSITADDFNADSTLPNETYSPACNFTKSFLRSAI